MEAKPAEMDALCHLDHAVQLVQDAGARHHQAPPHHGAIPSSQTLACTIPTASETGRAASGSAADPGCFEKQDTWPAYRDRPYSVLGTPHFVMTSKLARAAKPILVASPGCLRAGAQAALRSTVSTVLTCIDRCELSATVGIIAERVTCVTFLKRPPRHTRRSAASAERRLLRFAARGTKSNVFRVQARRPRLDEGCCGGCVTAARRTASAPTPSTRAPLARLAPGRCHAGAGGRQLRPGHHDPVPLPGRDGPGRGFPAG